MSAGATSLQGRYHDGRQPIGSPATLIFAGREAALIGAQVAQRFPVPKLRVSPRVGRADRFVALPGGGQFQCPDHSLLDNLPQESRSEGPVAWLEQRLAVAIGCVAIIVSLLAVGYWYGLPAAAERVAARIPIETEAALGEHVLTWLDGNRWFAATRLDKSVQDDIRKGFADLHADLPMAERYRLEFRDTEPIGPNAFALPGGAIVLTDQMVKAAKSRDEILAVLAHEIGHVELRHTLRHLLQDSAVAVVAAAITSDAASLSVAVAGAPALLAQAQYSREFEAEADEFAFRLLKRRGLSPAAFASLMERLAEKHAGAERGLSFLSTHPVTAERVSRARAAAAQ